MSTYHWIVCDSCHEKCEFVADNAGTRWYGNGQVAAPQFLQKHKLCMEHGSIRIISEHHPMMSEYADDSVPLNRLDTDYSWFVPE